MSEDEGRRPFKEREADRIPLHERIRNLRQKRGLTGYELARKAGISPSYVSLIENGLKVPEEAVAAAIAGALGDDQSLYLAWARTSRHANLVETRDALDRALLISQDQGLRKRLASGEELVGDDARPRAGSVGEVSRAPAVRETADVHDERCLPPVILVPLLAEGTDPDAAGPQLLEPLGIDAAAVPPEDRPGLFAYRVTARGARRLRGQVEAGSLVVISRRFRPPAPERIHAVRTRGEVVLSRTLWKGSSLLLLPSEGDGDFEDVEVGDASRLREILVGSVVLSLRRWD